MTKCCDDTVTSLFNEPFYLNSCIQQDHSSHVFLHQYIACLRISTEWIVPNDESEVWVEVPALVDVLIGSALWNPDYGYFLITAFDKKAQKLKLERYDTDFTADAGTTIPSCTKFIVVVPPNVGVGDPVEFTPALLNSPANTVLDSVFGQYWLKDDFVYAYYSFILSFTGNSPTPGIRFSLPVNGKLSAGNVTWIGDYQLHTDETSDELSQSHFYPIIGVSNYLFVEFGPDIAAVNGQTLTMSGFAVYPRR